MLCSFVFRFVIQVYLLNKQFLKRYMHFRSLHNNIISIIFYVFFFIKAEDIVKKELSKTKYISSVINMV